MRELPAVAPFIRAAINVPAGGNIKTFVVNAEEIDCQICMQTMHAPFDDCAIVLVQYTPGEWDIWHRECWDRKYGDMHIFGLC